MVIEGTVIVTVRGSGETAVQTAVRGSVGVRMSGSAVMRGCQSSHDEFLRMSAEAALHFPEPSPTVPGDLTPPEDQDLPQLPRLAPPQAGNVSFRLKPDSVPGTVPRACDGLPSLAVFGTAAIASLSWATAQGTPDGLVFPIAGGQTERAGMRSGDRFTFTLGRITP
jgi:hypothetical protein